MNIILKKAFSDMRLYPKRFLLVVFALIIGIWGVGSILVSYYVLSRDLSQNYINTHPAHAILSSKDFNKLDLATFKARPEIETAAFRDLSIHRIEVSPDRWIPLWLYGVTDFNNMKLARIYAEQGDAVPKPGTMLIERDGLLISDFANIKQAQVRVVQSIKNIEITGISFDPAQAPATQDPIIYGYMEQKSYVRFSGEAANQRLILRLNNITNREQVKKEVNRLLVEFNRHGIHINKVKIPKPNAHPHQWQLDTIILLEGSISLLAFVMAAVLVSQLMASILSKQIRQIGVLKAIGATRRHILAIYATMVLSLGLLAGIIGVPLAVLSGYGLSYFIAYKLNFNILTTELPLSIYAAIIIISLLLPFILSLPSILKGALMSVKDALSDYGISQSYKGGKTVIFRLNNLPANLLLSIRNTLRQKKRLSITLLTMALGVAIFSSGFNVRQSLTVLLQQTNDTMQHDVRVVLKKPIPRQQAMSLFSSIKNVRKIETWNGGFGLMQSLLLSSSKGIGIVALPYDTELLKPRILQGHWLSASNKEEVVMNMQAWALYNSPAIGSRQAVELEGKTVHMTLVGLIEEFEKPKVYVAQEYYNSLVNPQELVNTFMFAADRDGYDNVIKLKEDIERFLTTTDLFVLDVMSQAERLKILYDHLNIILIVLLFFAFTVLFVSALGMASTMGINILERTREIGVLRAIGATPNMVFKLFVTEGLLISVVSILLGLLMAWPLSSAASIFFGNLMLGGAELKFVVSQYGLWITLITTLVFAWLASRLPAQNALKISTQQALSYE